MELLADQYSSLEYLISHAGGSMTWTGVVNVYRNDQLAESLNCSIAFAAQGFDGEPVQDSGESCFSVVNERRFICLQSVEQAFCDTIGCRAQHIDKILVGTTHGPMQLSACTLDLFRSADIIDIYTRVRAPRSE